MLRTCVVSSGSPFSAGVALSLRILPAQLARDGVRVGAAGAEYAIDGLARRRVDRRRVAHRQREDLLGLRVAVFWREGGLVDLRLRFS